MADLFRTPDERFDGLLGYDFAPHSCADRGERLAEEMHRGVKLIPAVGPA